MKPRVLVVFSSRELGGAERSLTRMALASTGVLAVDVATLDGRGPWSDWCHALGATPIVFGDGHASRGHGRFGWRALIRLLRLVRNERYAVLYVIGLRASLMLRLAKPWLRGARLVQGVRWNPNSSSSLDRAFRLIEQTLGWLIDLYICNSHVAARTLEKALKIRAGRIRVIHNGLVQLPVSPTPLATRPLQVLTIANLSPRKGYLEYLQYVVVPVNTRLPEARFVIVGRDEMDGAVQRKILELGLDGVVTYLGFRKDVSEYLSDSRVFVLPSLWNEGCPTSILEAMSHRLPTVAFALDGIPELIEHNVDGVLVPLGDYEAMTTAIVNLLLSAENASQLGAHARDKVLADFKIENSVAAHISAFSELLAEQGQCRKTEAN